MPAPSSGKLPAGLPSTVKTTVPMGVPLVEPACRAATVAVNVRDWPATAAGTEATRLIMLPAGGYRLEGPDIDRGIGREREAALIGARGARGHALADGRAAHLQGFRLQDEEAPAAPTVGPPLFWSGPRTGSSGLAAVPVWSVAAVKRAVAVVMLPTRLPPWLV